MSAESNFSNAKFLTVAEVAELMRVSKMTVYRLVHSGKCPRFGSAGPIGFRRAPSNSTSRALLSTDTRIPRSSWRTVVRTVFMTMQLPWGPLQVMAGGGQKVLRISGTLLKAFYVIVRICQLFQSVA